MSFYLLLSEEGAKNSQALADQMTQEVQKQLPGCELAVSTSNMDMSALGGSGLQLRVGCCLSPDKNRHLTRH